MLDQRQKVNNLDNQLQGASSELSAVKTQLENVNNRIAEEEKELANTKSNMENVTGENSNLSDKIHESEGILSYLQDEKSHSVYKSRVSIPRKHN